MHGIGFDFALQQWFDFKIPKTTIEKNYISHALESQPQFSVRPNAKIIWLGGRPMATVSSKSKKGQTWELLKLSVHGKMESKEITVPKEEGEWLLDALERISVHTGNTATFGQLKADFETHFEDFELFWFSKPVQSLRESGLLTV